MSRTRLTWRGLNTAERGQTLVLFVFALAALMGLVALTVDVGLTYVARRDMQNAVDSAVLAGAARLAEGASPSVAAAEALEWVRAATPLSVSSNSLCGLPVSIPNISRPHSNCGQRDRSVLREARRGAGRSQPGAGRKSTRRRRTTSERGRPMGGPFLASH
jgi:hypothetical protein